MADDDPSRTTVDPFRDLVEAGADAVLVVSRCGGILYANPAAAELMGRPAAALVGQVFGIPVVGGPAAEVDLPGGRVAEMRAVQIRWQDAPAYFASLRDVTDRKLAEAAVVEANRRKDEFLAMLAHELRNPLAPVRNGLQVIRLSAERAKREEAQAMMARQLEHMVRLIDDLLDVSRINQGKMALRRARVGVADAVQAAVEAARPAIDAAGHELTVLLPPDPLVLDADLTRIAQVLSNLLTNSAKYTPPGGRIHLRGRRDGDAAVVTVRDTGIGIPAAALPTVFEMFSQVDRSVERATGGLGIGLALVKGLVEMHGGTVTAASNGPGLGSEFTVRLPLAAATSEAAPAAADADPVRDRRILVVDDNRDAAASMADMLRLVGNEVATAHDGLDAVEQAERFRPDVILMDVGMPRLNGLDATRRIRERDWGRGVAIFALTGWGQDADRERTRAAGCDGHLVKPVGLGELSELLAGPR
jgi:two-component system CheB/CheR fusion protein